MAITQSIAVSFKRELMQALHNFNVGGNAFKMALYTSAATLDSSTTVYTASNEVVGVGYTAGGNPLNNISPVTSGVTAYTDWDDIAWVSSTLTARGSMIYNSTNGNRTVCILDFGADKTSSTGDFTVIFPAAAAATAIIRIA